ncbi:MAG TPA: hypothetical protein VGC00_12970 [Thermoanaerobaculia bacterium]|jgi:hypothetical protein
MRSFTPLALVFLAAAGLLSFFAWQLLSHGFDASPGFRSTAVGVIGVLCGVSCALVVVEILSSGRATKSDLLALILGGLGIVAAWVYG